MDSTEPSKQLIDLPTEMPIERITDQRPTQLASITKTEESSLQPHKQIGRLVQNAIRQLQAERGCSLKDIKKFIAAKGQLDIKTNDAGIKSFLKNAVDTGILTKLGGKYKIREAAKRRRRSRSRKGATTGVKKRRRSRSKRSSGSKGRRRRRSGRAKSSSGRRRSRRKRRST